MIETIWLCANKWLLFNCQIKGLQIFQFSGKVQRLIFLPCYFVVCWDAKIYLMTSFHFLLIDIRSVVLSQVGHSFLYQIKSNFLTFHFLEDIFICTYTIWRISS